jgi:NADPH:quinone reductase-like Zn-dependent oxidoreductase
MMHGRKKSVPVVVAVKTLMPARFGSAISIKGRRKYPRKLPVVPGPEAAGVVEAISEDVTNVKPGDRAAYTG